MIVIENASLPSNCFRCFAHEWYNYGGQEVGFKCRLIKNDITIIPNCEGREKRRRDCPLKEIQIVEVIEKYKNYK